MAFSRRPLGILGILGISLALLLSTFPSRKSSELKRPSTRWWPLLSTGVPGLCTPHSRSRAQSLTPPSQAHTAHLAAQADAPCGSRIHTYEYTIRVGSTQLANHPPTPPLRDRSFDNPSQCCPAGAITKGHGTSNRSSSAPIRTSPAGFDEAGHHLQL
ncbi:hypothetical protein CPAR01_03872 [Colletotrichum paranaense]|uniref:Uncharacterized protein n=1 Tax=Colletotrichum paranaense TaxID=1914294 RepID=A0ABQ9SUP3_9PEZI|nr:uncharacterized protein CPAR01_03872 [Colletotrichum paranaense]KAK1543239.1 hypothetical protein CPAR01_03872 [Colletotrichum paranaense]